MSDQRPEWFVRASTLREAADIALSADCVELSELLHDRANNMAHEEARR
jgi:hypothetical protein